MLSFEPTEDEKAIRDEVRKLAENELRPAARACEKAREIPDALRKTYHELGLSTLDLPEAYGGGGLSTVLRVLVEEELAFGDAGLAVGLHAAGFAAYAIAELGTDEQKERWLREIASPAGATKAFAFALAEADIGSELGSVLARADRDAAGGGGDDGDGSWSLSGRKLFVADAHRAERAVVFARVSQERTGLAAVRAFVVPREAWKLGREDDRMGLNAVRSFEIAFEGARVPADALLGPPTPPPGTDVPGLDQDAFRRLLARIWIATAARQTGIARACVEYSSYYAQERTAFKQKIGQFQGIAFTIADMAMDADSARWMTRKAASELDTGRTETAAREAALALAHANDAAVRAGIDCVQVLGGAGFMEDYPAEKWMRDSRTLGMFGGVDPLRYPFLAETAFGPSVETVADPGQAFAAFGQAFGS